MTRSTIDFGIDLGTTNSEIALYQNGRVEVIKDGENFETTPSAVWIDGRDRLFVGRRAKDQHFSDGDNAKIEFKRQMGNDESLLFKDSGKRLKPEELSAAVLQHLKGSVREWLGEEIGAAVITVPADFNPAQIEATNRAARLAGLDPSPLVQEPVAAATAFGFKDGADGDDARWLVFDYGGGTFDAALMRRRDGLVRVENHGGDRLLGGKDIDWAIVETLLVPALRKLRPDDDFRRGTPRWAGAFAKLKIAAEKAKIQLSRSASTAIEFEELCKDERGQGVPFEYELRRADVEALTEPMIVRAINISRRVLAEARLAPQDIARLVLVGGPTLMPYMRQRLADPREGLGIPLDFSVDPFTVVARGAAIIAATQPLAPSTAAVASGEFALRLDYRAIGPDEDPLLSGQVLAPEGQALSAYTIEFTNRTAEPPWSSGRLALSPDGRFMTTLRARKGVENRFQVELLDGLGSPRRTLPDSFPYTVGSGAGAATLIHTIGIGTSDNQVVEFFRKGTTLPARRRIDLVTTVDARRGSSTDSIKVPVVGGEHLRADRNEIVGTFRIPASQFTRDVPAGSDLEVTLTVDESQRFTTKVYFQLLDEEFETVIVGTTQRAPLELLQAQVAAEKQRLARLRGKVGEHGEPRAAELLARVDQERLEQVLDRTLVAARNDPDAGDKCASTLHDLQVALDAVEEALHWPDQLALAEERIGFATRVVGQHGTAADKETLALLVREVRETLDTRVAGLVQARCTALNAFAHRIWRQTDEYLMAMLQWLEEQLPQMRDRALAADLLAQGKRAALAPDRVALRRSIEGLVDLLEIDVIESGPFADQSSVTVRAR